MQFNFWYSMAQMTTPFLLTFLKNNLNTTFLIPQEPCPTHFQMGLHQFVGGSIHPYCILFLIERKNIAWLKHPCFYPASMLLLPCVYIWWSLLANRPFFNYKLRPTRIFTVDVVQHEFEQLPGSVRLVVESKNFRIQRIPFQAQDLEKSQQVVS